MSFIFCENRVSISVVIPCDRAHLQFLPRLLSLLETQSHTPGEVVISVSNSNSNDDLLIAEIEENKFPFLLKIIRSSKRQFAGENRNIAIANSTGDLIICQDADDLPHKQRIEIIKNLFEITNFDFLLHLYFLQDSEPVFNQYLEYYNTPFPQDHYEFLTIDQSIDFFNIHNTHPEFFTKFRSSQITDRLMGVHFGNCAFKRTVFDLIQYNHNPSGQDVNFYSQVVHTFNNILLINQPLVYYVRSRSSYYSGRGD